MICIVSGFLSVFRVCGNLYVLRPCPGIRALQGPDAEIASERGGGGRGCVWGEHDVQRRGKYDIIERGIKSVIIMRRGGGGRVVVVPLP